MIDVRNKQDTLNCSWSCWPSHVQCSPGSPKTTFHTPFIQRPTLTAERQGPWQETVLHCSSNNNNHKRQKTKKLSYGRLSAMCFVFILTENKWYIFFKEEIKRHTEMVCRKAKGAKVQTIPKKKKKLNKHGELCLIDSHHLLSPWFVLWLANSKCIFNLPWEECCLLYHQF